MSGSLSSQRRETEAPAPPGWWNDRLERLLLALAVLLGAALSVLAALNQPYNQNEWVQIAPYDSWDPAVVSSGTRQPPLDPVLGALVQHVLGVGQLQQRLVPVAAGVGSLVVMALLLRRFGLHLHGVVALWFMATAPIFLRYNAYARPYALPLLLMLLCAYAGSRWLDGEGRRWLVVAIGGALLLPLARVPEPVVFLGSSALVLLLAGWRRWLTRDRAWWLGGGFLAALGSVGALSTLKLSSRKASSTGESLIDLNPGRALDRLPAGLRDLRDFVAPLYADWFPFWPVTLLVMLLAVALPSSRRRLMTRRWISTTWWWLPLVLAPLAFLAAYHSVNPYPLDERHYRIRFAYFWVPSLVMVVAVASEAVSRHARRAAAWAGPALVIVLLVSQLPTAFRVVTENDAVDVAQVARIADRLPADAVLLYDGPSPDGHWRQPFFGGRRWFDGAHARVVTPRDIGAGEATVGNSAGPVYLVVLDAPCVDSVACDSPDHPIGAVAGWRVAERYDLFTLYEPVEGQAGRAGAVEALEALADAYGPGYAQLNEEAAERLQTAG